MKVKQDVKKVTQSTKRVLSNGEQFIQATALLITAGFAYNQLHAHKFDVAIQWVVTASLVVIGLRGAYELIKFLDRD